MINNPVIKIGGTRVMPKQNVAPSNVSIAKMVDRARKFGNPALANQQFTEREIWDYLPMDGRRIFEFFKNVNTRNFPYTNIQENKLQTGETMVLKRIFFAVITVNPLNPEEVTNVQTLTAAGFPGLNLNEWEWFNDNVRTVKAKGGLANTPEFNKTAFNDKMNVYTLQSEITIPTLVQFGSVVEVPVYTPVANTFLGFHAEGLGTILNPKAVY